MKIYFAGGWFSPAQEEEHTRIGNFLERRKNLEVFNPRTAGGDFKPGTTGNPVPDGGATFGLFGLGLLGLGAIRRKLRQD